MPNFLNSPHATRTFPKYPFSSQNNITQQPTSTLNHPSKSCYIPPAERLRLAALAEENSAVNNCANNSPNSQNINKQKDFPTLQDDEAERKFPSQNCNNNTSPSKDVQEKSDSAWGNNRGISYAHRVQGPRPQNCSKTKILKMKIIPPFRKEHFTNPARMEKDVKEAYNAIMATFQPRNRIKITISITNIMKNGRY